MDETVEELKARLTALEGDFARQAEALRAQNAFIEGLVAAMPAGVAFIGRDLRVRMANPAYARLLDLGTPADVVGRGFAELFGEPGVALEAINQKIMETGESQDAFAYRLPLAAREVYFDVTRTPVFGAGGAIDGTLIVMQDVTERVTLGADLDRARRLTERIIGTAPVMMAFLDRDLIYRWSNPVHARAFGRTPAEIVGQSVQALAPEIAKRTVPWLRRAIETGEPEHGEAVPMLLDPTRPGVVSYVDFSYVPMVEDGRVDGLLILAVDVSERVANERLQAERIEMLQAADRAKDEFLSVISHELRTPLNFITGFASVLADEVQGPLNPPQRHAAEKILGGADRMLGIVNDLLDFARVQAGKLQLAVAPTAIGPLAEEVVALARPLAAARELALAIEVAPDLPLLPLDGPRVAQVLTNLVGNALKFTDAGGRVHVAVARQAGGVRCAVTDTGCGIAAEDLPRLFTRFSQLDMSPTRKAGGTGLGLAITKALVEAHGGRLGAESPGVGGGATFWFELPA